MDIDYPWDVDDFAYGEYDPHPGREYVLTGSAGAMVMSEDLHVVQEVDFSKCDWWHGYLKAYPVYVGDTAIVDADGDGVCEYFSWFCPFGGNPKLLNHQGNLLWFANPDPDSTRRFSSAFGDVDGDGNVEFCVLDEATGEARLLDHNGAQLWAKRVATPFSSRDATPLSPRHLILGPAMPDIDGDGKADIVTSDYKNIYVYSGGGALIRTIPLPSTSRLSFRETRVVTDLVDKEDYLLAYDERKGWAFIPFKDDGEWIPAHNRTSSELGEYYARYVEIDEDRRFLVQFLSPTLHDAWIPGFIPSSRFRVLDERGHEILYELVPAVFVGSFCVAPNSTGRGNTVLLAGGGKLYRYSLR